MHGLGIPLMIALDLPAASLLVAIPVALGIARAIRDDGDPLQKSGASSESAMKEAASIPFRGEIEAARSVQEANDAVLSSDWVEVQAYMEANAELMSAGTGNAGRRRVHPFPWRQCACPDGADGRGRTRARTSAAMTNRAVVGDWHRFSYAVEGVVSNAAGTQADLAMGMQVHFDAPVELAFVSGDPTRLVFSIMDANPKRERGLLPLAWNYAPPWNARRTVSRSKQ